MLREYEAILPGCANRFLQLNEKEQLARHTENTKIIHNDRYRIGGAIFVSGALIAASAFAVALGQPQVAIPLGLAGILSPFVKQVIEWLKAKSD